MPEITIEQAIQLAIAHHQSGRLAEAEAIYRQILAVRPDIPEIYNNLGAALREQGRIEVAAEAYREAIRLRPDHAEAWNNLAVALSEMGQPADAAEACRRALAVQPQFHSAHFNLGNALRDLDRADEALAAYRRALEIEPRHHRSHIALSQLLASCERYDEALAAFRRGLEFFPDSVGLLNNFGTMLASLGRVPEAVACIRRAVELTPHSAPLHSSLLAMLQLLDHSSEAAQRALFEAHCEFDRRHCAALTAAAPPHANSRNPQRRLRVGMVSPRFAFHPVGYFLVGLLENLDRGQFEVIGYSDTADEDAMTARLHAAMSGWRDVRALGDEQLAALVRADGVDILLDLAGHTAGNRLLAFARKPAPVQIAWLDFVGTTGLTAMDFVIGDPREIPPGAERWYREKVLRMPDDTLCYTPRADAPEVGPLPALANGHVTFACFNGVAKVTPEILRVWARVLAAVPGSRLILKNRAFDAPPVREHCLAIFSEGGISADRIEFRGWSPSREVLAAYRDADIALDTWPFNGGLTTCEALWMGVPVVTCPGETFASRHGLAHLTAAGLPCTIAHDFDDYVKIAASLAADIPSLAALRAKMRAQVAASPLCDAPRFAQNFAALLRGVWAEWCARA